MSEAMGEGHLLGQTLELWQAVASARVPWPQSLHGCLSPSAQEEHSHLFRCFFISWVYSPLFEALRTILLYSTSMACTVSSSSSRVSGFTVWDRIAVVPGPKRYCLGLEEGRDDTSTWAHQVAHLFLAPPISPATAPSSPVVPIFCAPTFLWALWVSSMFAEAWRQSPLSHMHPRCRQSPGHPGSLQ